MTKVFVALCRIMTRVMFLESGDFYLRFSNKIAILIATLVVVSGLIQIFVFDRFFFSTMDSMSLATNEKAANNIGESLSTYFKKTTTVVKTIATDDGVRESQYMLDKVNAMIPEINAIFILDRQGNVLTASGAKTDPSMNFGGRDYFQHAIQGETYISNVFLNIKGRQIVAIATPVVVDSQVASVVVATIWLHNDYLASMFDNKTFGRNGFVVIMDAQGIIIYHPDKERIGKKAEVFDALNGTSGAVVHNSSGKEQYIGYRRIPESNWNVAVMTPTSELKELRNLMIYQIIVASIITILVVSVIGVYALRRYMKPFENLVEAFSSLRKGKYIELSSATSTNEFSEMQESYNLTVRKLEEVHNKLNDAAAMDGLTEAYNRRSFEQVMQSLTSEMQAGLLQNVSVLFLDIDNLKELNDTQGHLVGDDVLRDFVAIVMSVVESRTLFRYGGDEFVIILRNSSSEKNIELAEAIRLKCEQDLRGCTLSIGIAAYPENADTIDEVMVLADKALYMSKRKKNMVTIYSAL